MAVYETPLSRTSGKIVGPGWAREVVCATAIVAMTTAMLDNANDDVGLFWVPAGAVVVGYTLMVTDMDTNGSPTLAFDVGDAADEDRLFSNSTLGQTGGISSTMLTTGYLYKFTTATQVRAYIRTAAATAAAGTLTFNLLYFVDPEFSTTALAAA